MPAPTTTRSLFTGELSASVASRRHPGPAAPEAGHGPHRDDERDRDSCHASKAPMTRRGERGDSNPRPLGPQLERGVSRTVQLSVFIGCFDIGVNDSFAQIDSTIDATGAER